MLTPLLLMAIAFSAYYVTVVILRLRSEILARKIRALRMIRIQAEGKGETGPYIREI